MRYFLRRTEFYNSTTIILVRKSGRFKYFDKKYGTNWLHWVSSARLEIRYYNWHHCYKARKQRYTNTHTYIHGTSNYMIVRLAFAVVHALVHADSCSIQRQYRIKLIFFCPRFVVENLDSFLGITVEKVTEEL